MRPKTYMSKINLQSGILTVENRRVERKKQICSEVSVNSLENESVQEKKWPAMVGRICRKGKF